MEPQVRYATTGDGVSIAYASFGEGPALIYLGIQPVTHLQEQLHVANAREFFRYMANGKQFVLYDGRNSGLSDRGVDDWSLDARVSDLHAVVDALNLDEYAIHGTNLSAPVAIAAAAARPSRVSHLHLFDPYVNVADSSSRRGQGLLALMEHDWVTYTESWAGTIVHWSDPQQARAMASLMRAAVTPADLLNSNAQVLDATAALADVRCPTLVMQCRDAGRRLVENAQLAARRIPNAQLIIIPGSSFMWSPDRDRAVAEHVTNFMGIASLRPSADLPANGDTKREPELRTILFTDLVGHTEMMRRLGDERGRDVLRAHERITRDLLKQYGGAEVKTMGDGFMASFASVTKAMDCAIALQRAFAAHEGEPLQVRVGLNAGEPIDEDGDLFGSTVIMASRIAAKAGAGEILIPEPLRHLLSGKTYVYADRGETMLKGFEDAVRLYEVRWQT